MPYMGEEDELLFKTFILGSFALVNDDFGVISKPVSFDMEWIVPAELDSCLAYSEDKCCAIYDKRPVSCRNFPVINHEGGLHDFCPHGASFSSTSFEMPNYVDKASRLAAFLEEIYKKNGKAGLCPYLLEEHPAKMPLLYNGLWCLFLKLADIDLLGAVRGQKHLLNLLKQRRGISELTVLIPGTDYCITGDIDGLLINLDYLALRIEKEGIEAQFLDILSEIPLG